MLAKSGSSVMFSSPRSKYPSTDTFTSGVGRTCPFFTTRTVSYLSSSFTARITGIATAIQGMLTRESESRVLVQGSPIPAFELYSAHSPSLNELQRHDWNTAVDLFTEGRWADAYDLFDRLTSVTDPLGRTTTYAYDRLGRRISATNPAIQATPLAQQT